MPVSRLLNLVRNREPRRHAVPDGERIYAIGDIHGRLDLLNSLLDRIHRDDDGRDPARTTLIFLGDLIDRGPDSRGVVDRAIELAEAGGQVRFLMGNHEEVFLRAVGGDVRALRLLLRIGGRETILSYGIAADAYRTLDFAELSALLSKMVPARHVDFLGRFEQSIEVGDYLFVHAGIRPGVSISEQTGTDMRWIRDDFLRHRDSFEKVVVHGHSITDEADVRSNRIGIDTGAFSSGRLTALGLETDRRWFLST